MFRCEGVLEYGERLSRSGIRKPYRLLIRPSGDQLNPVSMVDTTLLTKLDSLISNNNPVTVERLEGKRTRDNPQITVSQGFLQFIILAPVKLTTKAKLGLPIHSE